MTAEEEILSSLESTDDEQRAMALQALIKSPSLCESDAVRDCVEKLTRTSDIAVKFWARKVFSKFADAPETASKTEVTKDSSAPLSIDLLFQKLQTVKSSYVAIDTIRKIVETKDPAVIQPLIVYLESCTDVVVVSYLTKSLGIGFPNEEILPTLAKYLKHEDDRVVANTIEGMEGINSPKTVVLITQVLGHKHHRVKANAAKALAKQDPVISNQVITRMLQMRDRPHFVIAGMYAVKTLQDKRFLGVLQELVSDPLVGETAKLVIDSFNEKLAKEGPSKQPVQAQGKASDKPAGETLEQQSEKPKDWFETIVAAIMKPLSELGKAGKNYFLEGFVPIFQTVWKWAFRGIGILAAIGFVYLLTVGFSKLSVLKPKLVPKQPEWEIGLPESQKNVVLTLEELNQGFTETTNKLRRAKYIEEVKNKLRTSLEGKYEFSDWIGEVVSLDETTSDGAVLEVSIKAPNVSISLRNSAKTAKDEKITISKDSSLYKDLMNLEIGQKIKVSGKFVRNDTSYAAFAGVDTEQMTERNTTEFLKKPCLSVQFTDIENCK